MLARTKKQKSLEKQRKIIEAYRKTKSPAKKKVKVKKVVHQDSDSDDDSLEISDIENIRKQINVLEKKICGEEK